MMAPAIAPATAPIVAPLLVFLFGSPLVDAHANVKAAMRAKTNPLRTELKTASCFSKRNDARFRASFDSRLIPHVRFHYEFARTKISTRRLSWRPLDVLFEALGFDSPYP